MRTAWLIGVMTLAIALPAQAQRGPGRGGPPDDNQMRPRRGQMRGQRMGMRGPGGMMPMGLMAGRLADELELTDEQRELYDEIVDKYEDQMQQRREQGGGMRELGRQYREARQSGDEELATEIREKMREMVGGRGQIMNDFIDEVETILDPPQVEKLNAFRDRMRQMRQRGDVRRLIRSLPDQLDMTDEQREQFDEMVAEQREQIGQRMREWRESRSQMQAELREAEETGDVDLASDLREELMHARPAPPEYGSFFDQLETILTDEQKAKLAELRENPTPARPPGRPIDVRTLLRAAKRLDLDSDQKAKFKEIMRTAQQAERKGRRDRAGRAERSELVKKQIMEILTPEQREQFEKLLGQDRGRGRPGRGPGVGRRGSRGDGPGRGGDAGRGRGQAPGSRDF